MNALEINNLVKTYKGKKNVPDKLALNNVSLHVKQGEIYGLLGPNGAGKSTLINILAGLVKKNSGEVKIWGYDLDSDERKARMMIGVVPQEITVDVFFTPYEALEIQAGLYGIRKKDRISEKLLNIMSLEDKKNAYIRQLSGGMKRRLTVAKAMVHQPKLLILDEPTAGVDIELRKQLWEYVVELNQKGTTIILTTHYLEEAQKLCDRIAIVDKGVVKKEAAKKDLLLSLDQKKLVITLEDPENYQENATLDNFANLENIVSDGNLVINYHPSRDKISDILDLCKKNNIKIRDITTIQANLEDIFLSLTYQSETS